MTSLPTTSSKHSQQALIHYRPGFSRLPGRCLVCKHGSHVINIPKADWSSVNDKQLTATPCEVLVGDQKWALCVTLSEPS